MNNETIYDTEKSKANGGTTIWDQDALSTADGSFASDAAVEDVCYKKGVTILDTYRVESDAIESGGMGRVWRVHHTLWNVDLAMKRPRAEYFSGEESKQNFIRECDTWITLGLHPNIVSCYYVRLIDGIPTIFSEWMDGGDLAHAINSGTLYEYSENHPDLVQERILDIAIQFARGLYYAHESRDDSGNPQKLIHRDVKPGNVLLSKSGEVKVSDFGLTKAVTQPMQGNPADGTKGSCFKGTPAYCSAEQMDEKPLTLQTDLYSWAVSVMEMYRGSHPWANGVVAGMSCRKYFADAKVPVPTAMANLLERCLAARPDDRPRDFGLVIAELRAIYGMVTGKDYPREASQVAADTADSLNNRALSMLDLGKPEEAEKLWERALTIEPDNLDCVFNQSLYLWRLNRISDENVKLLCEVAAANQPYRHLSGFWRELLQGESGMLNDQYGAQLTCYANDSGEPISLSKNGSLLLAGHILLSLVDVQNDTILYHYKTVGEHFSSVKLLSDGLRFLTISEETARIWDIHSGNNYVLCLLMNSYYLSSDESFLYVFDEISKTLCGWNIETGECEFTINLSQTDLRLEQNKYCVSPDRTTLYTAGEYTLIAIDITSGNITGTYALKNKDRYTSISCDGTRLYLHSYSDDVEVWDIATMALIRRIEVRNMEFNSLCYSEDNRVLAVSDFGGFIHVWQNTHAGCMATLKAQDKLADFTVSGDGTVIVSCEVKERDHYFRVWRTTNVRSASFEISRAVSSSEFIKKSKLFDEACSLSRDCIHQKNITEALNQIQRASTICGSISNEHIRELLSLAGKFCIRKGILGSYVYREQSGIDYSAGAICLSSDGQSYFTCNDKKRNFLQWDFRTGSLIRTFGSYEYGHQSKYLATDDQYLYTRDGSGTFCVWDISSGELISKRVPPGEHYTLCFSDDKQKVLYSNGEDMFLEKSLDGTILQKFHKHENIYFDCISSVSLSLDERYALVADLRRNTVLWDVQKGDMISKEYVPYHVFTEFSLDSKVLAMKTDDDNRGVYDICTFGNQMDIVDIKDCAVFQSFAYVPVKIARASTINPKSIDRKFKVLSNGRFLGLWDLKKKERVLGIYNQKPFEMDFSCYCLSSDERWLLIGSYDGKITVWGIEYEYAFPGWADWDEEAQPYLDIFLDVHPNWNTADFNALIARLQGCGFGWLRPEGVREQLKKITASRGK